MLEVIAGGANAGPASTLVLELIQRLERLADWEPVGSLLQDARDALRGDGGLSAREVAKMQRWANRWDALRPTLQMLYQKHAHRDDAAHVALLSILAGTNPPGGPSIGHLKELFIEQFGYAPPYDIAPTARTRA
jgi:hypothetical protein